MKTFKIEKTWTSAGEQSVRGMEVIDGFNITIQREVIERQNFSVRPLQLGHSVEETCVQQAKNGVSFGYVVAIIEWSYGQQDDGETHEFYVNGRKVSKKTYEKTKAKLGF